MENTRAAPCILHNADTAATKHKNRRDRPGGFLSLLSPRRRARRRAAAPVKQTGSSASNAKRAPRSMLRGARQLFSIGSQLGFRMSLRSTSAARPMKQASLFRGDPVGNCTSSAGVNPACGKILAHGQDACARLTPRPSCGRVDAALSWASAHRSGPLRPRPSTDAPARKIVSPRP